MHLVFTLLRKVDFGTGTGRKAFFDFFRPDSGPPLLHKLLQRKKGKFIGTGHFFPHCVAFFEKGGGLVLVYVFLFPVLRWLEAISDAIALQLCDSKSLRF